MSILARVMFAVSMLLPAAIAPAAAADFASERSRAYTALAEGRFESAVEIFTSAIQSGTLSEDELVAAYNGRADAYDRLKHHEMAIADYKSAVSLNPRSAGAYTARGIAHKRLGQYERALADFDIAVSLDPDEAIHFLNRGGAYAELKRFDEAIHDLDTAIELNPSIGLFWYSRGLVYEEAGEPDKAKEDFKQALTLSPDYPPLRMKADKYGLPH